ncbi:zinc finger B-box domain-containing protein 1 isoform X4 [Petromyzon marinus]|uniref:Zinc finger B-box domain-containing protein 1 isoform X3 n=1 Tax=Petromyzon marinus TaxID=7757 RepID=A0AAJ7U7C5_PETMA|nr:zinc finger B-box domain-containing protein 1 isoform X3 [Petromyzon marinus]
MERQGFVVLPGNKEPVSAKLKARSSAQALRGETLRLAVDNTELEEQLEKLRREGQRLREEKRQAGGFHWKTGKTGALTLPSNAVPRQGSKVGSGKVRIRVLKEQVEEVKKAIPVSSPQTKWVTEAKRAKKCGQCENKPALLVCVECGEDFCVPCFSRMHHKGALRSHRSHPIQSETVTLTLTPDVVQRFKRDMGSAADGRDVRERGFPKFSNTTPPLSNTRAQDTGVGFTSPSPPSTEVSERRKLDGRAPGFGQRGLEEGAKSGQTIGPIEAEATQGGRRGGQIAGVRKPGGKETRGASGPGEVSSRRGDGGTGGGRGTLLEGDFSEEESSRAFQEAVAAWRGAAGPCSPGPERTTRGSVSVSVEAREEIPIPGKALLSLNFPENSALSYMDRLLLKKHRRTPIEGLGGEAAEWRMQERRSVQFDHGDENASGNLEERKYYVEIFAAPQASIREPRPESSLTIVEMAEGENFLEETEGFVLEEDGSPVNISYSDEVEPRYLAQHSPLLDGGREVSARTPRQQAPKPVTPSPRGDLDTSERGLTTEPSEDLKNVGSRIKLELPDYQGLQGFFSIGLSAGGEHSGSRHGQNGTDLNGSRPTCGTISARTNADAARTASASGAALSLLSGRHGDSRWRADNSLGLCADAELTKAVLEESRSHRQMGGSAYRPRSPATRLAAHRDAARSAASATARPSSSPSSSRSTSSPLTPLSLRPTRSGGPGRGVRMSGALDVESNRDSDEDEERIVGSLERELALAAVQNLQQGSPGESG